MGSLLDLACRDIINELLAMVASKKPISDAAIGNLIKEVSRKRKLKAVPRQTDILRLAPESVRSYFRTKPVRTASGVAVVAVMCKPHRCPHQATTGSACIYCPGGPDSEEFDYSTQSYTGREPTSLRAIRARYHPFLQVRCRIDELRRLGHGLEKVEIILMGGTFMALDQKYREWFITCIHDALSGHTSGSVDEAIAYSEFAEDTRCVGLTIETRPDYCLPHHMTDMLRYGATRLELGLQSPYADVILACNRGHTLRSVHRCLAQVREAGIKVTAHMMPNLPGVPLRRDAWGFRDLFESPRFRPDGLKLYPTLVMVGTELFTMWEKGEYTTFCAPALMSLLEEVFAMCPPWTRVYRVQRDIPPDLIDSGVHERANSREWVLQQLRASGRSCYEIRSREAGIRALHCGPSVLPAAVHRVDYSAASGHETFITVSDTETGTLFGLLRLRKLGTAGVDPRPEFAEEATSMVREVHVYGAAAAIDVRARRAVLEGRLSESKVSMGGEVAGSIVPTSRPGSMTGAELDAATAQHTGVGGLLLAEAERIAADEHKSTKISIISGVGVRNYYKRFGYTLDGPYMSKKVGTPSCSWGPEIDAGWLESDVF